jgi:hypothetical protein
MKRKTQIIALASAALIGAGVVGACSSAASSVAKTEGIEAFAGEHVLTAAQASSQTYVPTIPLKAKGLFSDSGSIYLAPGSGKDGNGPGPATIKLSKGDINVNHGSTNPNLQPKPVGPASACVFGFTQKVSYTVTGGTGAYSDVKSGSGVATVTEAFKLPRTATGACASIESTNVAPVGGSVTFAAVGTIHT